MIRLTNLADYAVVLMSRMAMAPDTLHNATDLAKEGMVPPPTASKILNALGRAGLLTSQRGLKGGFQLAKSSAEITVADIIEAMDGPIALTHCIETAPGDCCHESICGMRPHWQLINQAVKGALSDISLAEIATPSPLADLMQDAGLSAAAGRN